MAAQRSSCLHQINAGRRPVTTANRLIGSAQHISPFLPAFIHCLVKMAQLRDFHAQAFQFIRFIDIRSLYGILI